MPTAIEKEKTMRGVWAYRNKNETQNREYGELTGGEHKEIWGEWHTWKGHGSSVPPPHAFPYASLPFGCSEFILLW